MPSLAPIFSTVFFFLLATHLASSASFYPYLKRSEYDISENSIDLVDKTILQDASQFNWEPINITELSVTCSRINSKIDYHCNLTFSWFDPNSVRQNDVNSGVCRTAWSWDGVTKHNATLDGSDPVASYNSCWHDDLTYFKVAVPAFWHPANFSLELAHRNFTKPWDYPTTFGDAPIHIGRQEPLSNKMSHYHPGPINGTIIGVID
ncbi:hypothetical protein B0J18DRAFT_410084 [Chaetomium sp. MPI-SDFR-AT-0129]|nr:hypothetical protein B0J18DRAFT_410084 [Chaetomium sp. MPI-SDFR-AT-0129]